MQITESREGPIGILALAGALDAMGAVAFSERATAMCDAGGIGTLLIDMSEVSYITSAGFRALLVIQRHAEPKSIGLALCGLNEVVTDLFEVSAFDSLFRVCPDRPTALRELAEPQG